MILDITTIAMLLGILANLVAVIRLYSDKKKEVSAQIAWQATVDAKIEALTDRVDSHNSYAEKFSSCTRDIAYIRGLLEQASDTHNLNK